MKALAGEVAYHHLDRSRWDRQSKELELGVVLPAY